MLTVTFWGVRGSTPCPGPHTAAYGGNTACVVVDRPGGAPPIIFDLGTGVTAYGRALASQPDTGPFAGVALVSHLHWDHIQGIPFFGPILRPGAELDLYGPVQSEGTLADAFGQHIAPPVFPVSLEMLPGTVRYHEMEGTVIEREGTRIESFEVPHVGPTIGFRIDHGDASLAFICDHQQPYDGSLEVPPHIVEACAGVDLLIHDSQYSVEEFAVKSTWGHCTPEFALEVALLSEAKRLVLFHHDPSHDDAWVAAQHARIEAMAGERCQVLAAAEGMVLTSGA
ncbi:MAG: MBL fold metallo-hydrolase [Actinomycetota bacterium]